MFNSTNQKVHDGEQEKREKDNILNLTISDNIQLYDRKLIIYVGIRCKIFDTFTRYEPFILFLERYFSFITIPLYRYLDNPGPRHLEFFLIRFQSIGHGFLYNGSITSFESENPNATLIEKLVGTESKLVLSQFFYDRPHQFYISNGTEPPSYELREETDNDADAGAELSKNCRYTYMMTPITAMTEDLQREIFASVRWPRDRESPITGVFSPTLRYNLRRFNCGTYSMRNTCIKFSTEYLDPSNYIPYAQFRNELDNALVNWR